jgi:hypothetical protein
MGMKDWNGKPIDVVKSKNGRPFPCDYSDNLIRLNNQIWPHPFITKKLHRANRTKSFSKENYDKLSIKLCFVE